MTVKVLHGVLDCKNDNEELAVCDVYIYGEEAIVETRINYNDCTFRVDLDLCLVADVKFIGLEPAYPNRRVDYMSRFNNMREYVRVNKMLPRLSHPVRGYDKNGFAVPVYQSTYNGCKL